MTIECLLKSIPTKKLLGKINVKYGKVEIQDDSFLKKYNIKKLPCLLFFKNGKLIGKIEGYYEFKDKEEVKERINKIVSRIK